MSLLKSESDQNNGIKAYIKKAPCILAVDDHEDSLILLTQFLDLLGFVSLSASNAEQTYVLATEYQPDLILLDIVLPEMDGIELLHHLRQDKLTQGITVVALTALALAEEQELIMEAGFDDYLVKPYVLGELEALLYLHLQSKFPNVSRHNWRRKDASVPGQK